MFLFWRKPKDWEVWWAGYWRGLKGSGQGLPSAELIKGRNFMIYNDGWDEGIEDRGKLNQLMNK
jgi:hypothetical protein